MMFYMFCISRYENSSEPISEIISINISVFDGIFYSSVSFNFSTIVINDNPPTLTADPDFIVILEGKNFETDDDTYQFYISIVAVV